MKRPGVLFPCTVLLLVSPAAAGEILVTDRPDFTESAVVVPVGRLQLEFGVTGAEEPGGVRTTTAGEALLRWGVAPQLELRLQLPSWERESWRGWRARGFSDAEVGIKMQFPPPGVEPRLFAADWALILATTLPTGNDELSAGVPQPSAILAGGWELVGDWSLGANLGLSRSSEEGQRVTHAWLSASLGLGLGDGTGAFVELVAAQRDRPGGPGSLILQTGLTRRLGADFQLDVRFSRRLTSEGPDLLAGVGASVRW